MRSRHMRTLSTHRNCTRYCIY